MTRTDLHAHTTASDGRLSPAALVELAVSIGLESIAITDHDTTDGIAAARQAAPAALQIVPGVELSAEDAGGDVHMLGYFIDAANPHLQHSLEEFRIRRYHRGRAMVDRLAQFGLSLDWAQVAAQAGDAAVGRAHIARALVEAGYVTTVPEAFDRYLHTGGPAYVARKRLSPEEAIALIHHAGGAAVLAHPVFVVDYPAMIERLLPAGLDGVEVAYPDHSPELQAELRHIAGRHGLIMTGGSDFHGLNMPGKAMLGAAVAPPGAVEALRERAADYPPVS